MQKIKEQLKNPIICFISGIVIYLIVYKCGTLR